VPLLRDIPAGEVLRRSDVALPESEALQARCEMERRFAPMPTAIAAQ
jgi:hypothetical protein